MSNEIIKNHPVKFIGGVAVPVSADTTPGASVGALRYNGGLEVFDGTNWVLVGTTPPPPGIFIKQDGTVAFTGNENMGGFLLKNLGTAVDQQDAVRLVDLNNATVWKTIDW